MLILGCDTSSIASGALIRVPGIPSPGPGADPWGRFGPEVLSGLDVLGTFATEDTRSHAEVMAPGLRRLLDDAGIAGRDLDLVLTGIGPGPFTGLRVGIVTARTLGWAWNVPVRGAMSLDALAEQALDAGIAPANGRFAVATDARRREVYAAVYETGAGPVEDENAASGSSRAEDATACRRLLGPAVGPAAEIFEILGTDPVPALGRGALLYPESLDLLPGSDAAPAGGSATDGFEHPRAEYLVRAALRGGPESTTSSTTPLYLRESDARVPAARKKANR